MLPDAAIAYIINYGADVMEPPTTVVVNVEEWGRMGVSLALIMRDDMSVEDAAAEIDWERRSFGDAAIGHWFVMEVKT